MHPKQAYRDRMIDRMRRPAGDPLPPNTSPLWLFCWPETETHQIVAARSQQEAVERAKGNPFKALREPYYGGPCPICGSFDLQLLTIGNQPKGEKNDGKVIPIRPATT